MNLKAWRYVESGYDGDTTYQCLSCGKSWVACESPEGWTYCPHCACKWGGEHKCRPHSIARWQWDLWPEGREPYKPYDASMSEKWAEEARRANLKRIWVIECRTRFKGDDWNAWKFDQHVYTGHGHAEAGKGKMDGWEAAKRTLDYLRTDRQSDEWIQYEFRARVLTQGDVR